MNATCVTRWLTVFALMLLSAGLMFACDDPPAVRERPPTATFDRKDGWLTIRVTDGEKPLSGVSITCLVGLTAWAEGQTDTDGRGAFPVPKAEWCQIVFDLGAGSSAPVPLTLLNNGTVVPVTSPILDGTAECCIVPGSDKKPEESSSLLTPNEWWGLTGIVALGSGLGAGIAYVLIVRPKPSKLKSRRNRK